MVASVWWMSRESTIRWLAQTAVSQSDGALELEGVHGSLWSGIEIARVHFDSPDLAVTIERLHLVWFWLPPKRIQIPVMSIDRAIVERKRTSADPTPTPETLALPVSVHIGRAEIAHLASVAPDGSAVRLEGIALDGRADARGLDLALHVHDALGVQVAAHGRIAAAAPFDTELAATLSVPSAPMLDVIEVHAKGPLERLPVVAQARFVDSAAAPATLSTVVMPFSLQPLQTVTLDAPRLTASAMGVSGLQAQMTAQAALRLDAQQHWRGQVHLENTLPGGLEAQRVPVRSVAGSLGFFDGELSVDALKVQLLGEGVIEGQARWADGQGSLDLSFKALDPSALHAQALQTRLDGQVRVRQESMGAVQAVLRLSGGGLALMADARWQGAQLTLPRIEVTAGAGRLTGRASLSLDADRAFALTLEAQDFDPSRLLRPASGQTLPRWLDARLDAKAGVQGHLIAHPRGDWWLDIDRSKIAGLPLSGQTSGHVDRDDAGWTLHGVRADLRLADSQLVVQGDYGADDAVLSAALIAQKLDRLAPLVGRPLGGSLAVHATAVRQGGRPTGVVAIDAHALRLGSAPQDAKERKDGPPIATLGTLEGAAQLVDGAVDARFVFTDAVVGASRLVRSTLEAKGQLEQHEIRFSGQGSSYDRPLDAVVELAGGWTTVADEDAWRGALRRFENSGKLPLRLRTPAAIVVGASQQRIEGANVELAGGRIEIERLLHQAGQWQTRGRFDALAVQALSRWLPAFETPRTTLSLAGAWEARIGADTIDASVSLRREEGDIWLSTASAGAMALESLEWKLDVVHNQVSTSLAFISGRLGRLSARLQTTLSQRDGRWGVAGAAPLDAQIQGEMQSLAWLGLVTDTPLNAEGRIQVDAKATGTVGAPHLGGVVTGDKLSLRTFAPRAQLTDGRVRIVLDDRRIVLDEFVFLGRGGQLAASGQIDLTGGMPEGLVDVAFHKLAPLSDPLYHIVASGAVRIEVAAQAARVSGQLRADEARLTLQDALAPSLSGDVVVSRDAQVPTAPPPAALPVTLALTFDLGDRFHVSGYGADAWLAGALTLEAKPGSAVVARGAIETRRGAYLAYGQQLTVEEGTLTFSGPLDNPGVHLKAQRPNLPVTVGVEVTGSVAQPKARLYAEPAMTNTEILSWLVLGRGLEGTTRKDAQLLSLAAGALLSKGDSVPVQTRLARSVGLDEISVRDDATLETSVIAIGKRLSDRLYLSFERSLSGPATLAKLRYEVGKRWFIQGLTGTDNAVDVFFSFQFD